MNKKTTKKSDKRGGERPDKEALVLAALKLAQGLGWQHVRMRDIAEEAGIAFADIFEMFDDKTDILVALGRMIDKKVLANAVDMDESVSCRDRLFDILMERFDVLNDHRDGIIAVLHSFRFDPKQAVISMPHLCRSMTWMLEASGIETDGLRGAIKVAGLTGVYLKVLKTWSEDDSPDMGKTMAALDKNLGRAEKLANSFGF